MQPKSQNAAQHIAEFAGGSFHPITCSSNFAMIKGAAHRKRHQRTAVCTNDFTASRAQLWSAASLVLVGNFGKFFTGSANAFLGRLREEDD